MPEIRITTREELNRLLGSAKNQPAQTRRIKCPVCSIGTIIRTGNDWVPCDNPSCRFKGA